MEITTLRLLPCNLIARRLRVPVKWLRAECLAGRVPCLIAENKILCDLQSVESALLERVRTEGGDAHE
jgi:hypothetical protein